MLSGIFGSSLPLTITLTNVNFKGVETSQEYQIARTYNDNPVCVCCIPYFNLIGVTGLVLVYDCMKIIALSRCGILWGTQLQEWFEINKCSNKYHLISVLIFFVKPNHDRIDLLKCRPLPCLLLISVSECKWHLPVIVSIGLLLQIKTAIRWMRQQDLTTPLSSQNEYGVPWKVSHLIRVVLLANISVPA